jgi:WXXGXW repeat (2 copies)
MRFLRALLLAAGMLFLPVASFAQVSVAITIAPPELPVYAQPICPGDGYIWTPGYWAYGPDGYYWVPGTWVEPPQVGFLWTPGYWGWGGAAFIFHEGYWGPHVGFYGGINYGYGYVGRGYEGGRWDGGHFYYNRAVNNVNVTVVHNVYETRVTETHVTRVSYNGGHGGIEERPTREEETYSHERHDPPREVQTQHVEAARANPELRASANHGKPPIAATSKPGAFHEATPASEGHYNEPARSETGAAHTNTAVHPKELPPAERPETPHTGNAKTDQKYQQQQAKLSAQQDKDRQKLQQNQDKEHQRMQQQKVNETKNQQVEQKHQQQTQQLQQKHVQQQQHLQQKQQPAHQSQASAPKEKH